MSELDALFEEEGKIQQDVREISQGVLDLSDYVLAKSALELGESQIVGRKIREVCDRVGEHVHIAKRKLAALMSNHVNVKFKKAERELHEMSNELALIHGDLEIIGTLAEGFYAAKKRDAAFENINKHYSQLMRHLTSLMMEEANLKQLI
jgi:phosphate uptake regulator